jgi:negative regulator of flagellin synthesis FlgM
MKINNSVPPEASKLYGTVKKAGKTVDTGAAAQTNSTGSVVNLSARARSIDEMTRAIGQLPEVREDKVNDVKKSIGNGTYTVNPGDVAGKMLDEIA